MAAVNRGFSARKNINKLNGVNRCATPAFITKFCLIFLRGGDGWYEKLRSRAVDVGERPIGKDE